MMLNIAEATPTMQQYFTDCVDLAKGEKTESGIKLERWKRFIASYADLALRLKTTKAELMATATGSPEEMAFFEDMQMRYEVAVHAMYNAHIIERSTYEDLIESFQKVGQSSEKMIVLQFPDFKAPEDWEDYKEFKALFEEKGLNWNKAMRIIEKAMEGKK
jgi:hypothetical protein